MKLDPNKWYFKTYAYIVGFLCIGPLILPLAWINPHYNTSKKVIVTVITIIVSYFLLLWAAKSVETICSYYQQVMQMSR